MSRVAPTPTTTTYAVLGLLSVKPWTAHELVRQVDRSLRRIWPRAQSKLYEEPKKLVALGWARSAVERTGARSRTRYTITPAGRRALAAWLEEPGTGPVLECEQLVKVHFADSGTTTDLHRTIEATLRWAGEQNDVNLTVARAYLEGEGPFPERAAVTQLVRVFLTEYYAMVARWAQWALETVERWPDDPREARPDPHAQADAVRVAERTAELTEVTRAASSRPD